MLLLVKLVLMLC